MAGHRQTGCACVAQDRADIVDARLTAAAATAAPAAAGFNCGGGGRDAFADHVRQNGRMNTRSNSTALYNSMDSKNHLIGETIDWTPSSQVYLQANVNLVYATISTAYPRAGGTANDVVQNSDNNYSNGSLITGFVVDKATDAQLQFTWYHTNNFRPLVTSTLPLGSSVSEYTVTLGLKHKFTDRMIVHAKLGYFDSKNDSTGGKTSFHGPLAYLAFEHAL